MAKFAGYFSDLDEDLPHAEGRTFHWYCIALIIGITALIYLSSLGNGFVADDNEFVVNNESIKNLQNIPAFFSATDSLASRIPEWGTHIYRPLRTASYALDYALFGLNSTGYHIINLFIHILVCITIYFLIIKLFNKPIIALSGSLIFALHPLHVEAVSWIASRADLIGTLFLMLSILSYIYYRAPAGRKIHLLFSLFFSFLAYLGKESMVVLPGIIILYDYAANHEKSLKGFFQRNALQWTLFVLLSVCYLILRFSVTGRMDQQNHWWGGSATSNLLMMIKATAIYIKLLFFPFNLKIHYMINPVSTVLDLRVLLSLAVIFTSFIFIYYFHKNNRKIFFLMLWFYVGLLPVANIIPLTFSVMGERYMYMPSAGPIIAIAFGIHYLGQRFKKKEQLIYGFFIIILILFSLRVITRNTVFTNEFTFYNSAIASSPDSAPSYKGLGDLYFAKKDYIKAATYFRKASEIDPGFADALIGEAVSLMKIGDRHGALQKAKKALSIKPDSAAIRYNAGNIYKDNGDLENALAQWEKAVELNPGHPESYNNLGNYYMMKNDHLRAFDMYRKTLDLNPENAETHYNIAIIFERQGDISKARDHYLLFIKFAGTEYKETVESVKKRYGTLSE